MILATKSGHTFHLDESRPILLKRMWSTAVVFAHTGDSGVYEGITAFGFNSDLAEEEVNMFRVLGSSNKRRRVEVANYGKE